VPVADLDACRFDVLTFDCYGTLIDWETGLSEALAAVLRPRGLEPPDDDLLESYARQEAEEERGAYRPYREVLARSLRGVCRDYGVTPSDEEARAFADSVGDWPAFADSGAALARLAERFRLGVITNCDDDLFTRSRARLGVSFDWVVTAQAVGSYKPDPRMFQAAFEAVAVPRERILHVAQSLYHDHVPARQLGMSTVWIQRRVGTPGPDMATFADAALG
jgi:2-haloacid dehalogenase